MQTYACFNMFLQEKRLVQAFTRGRASFCTSDLGEKRARCGSSNEVHCAGHCMRMQMRAHVQYAAMGDNLLDFSNLGQYVPAINDENWANGDTSPLGRQDQHGRNVANSQHVLHFSERAGHAKGISPLGMCSAL